MTGKIHQVEKWTVAVCDLSIEYRRGAASSFFTALLYADDASMRLANREGMLAVKNYYLSKKYKENGDWMLRI